MESEHENSEPHLSDEQREQNLEYFFNVGYEITLEADKDEYFAKIADYVVNKGSKVRDVARFNKAVEALRFGVYVRHLEYEEQERERVVRNLKNAEIVLSRDEDDMSGEAIAKEISHYATTMKDYAGIINDLAEQGISESIAKEDTDFTPVIHNMMALGYGMADGIKPLARKEFEYLKLTESEIDAVIKNTDINELIDKLLEQT